MAEFTAHIEENGGAFGWIREGNPGKAPLARRVATITGKRREVERVIQGVVNLLNEGRLNPETLTRRRRAIPAGELAPLLPDRSLRQERKILPKRTTLPA